MQLVKPTTHRADSFEETLRECETLDELYQFGYEFDTNGTKSILDFGVVNYINALEGYKLGVWLPPERVPQTTLWLVEDDLFIGQIKRRHELNPYLTTYGGHIGYVIRPSKRQQGYGTKILTLWMEYWKAEWIKQLLVTCNEKNIASRKIIEANGGVYFSKVRCDDEQDMKLRYWMYL